MQGAERGFEGDLAGEGLRIGIVQARFTNGISQPLGQIAVALERMAAAVVDARRGGQAYDPQMWINRL